MKRLVTLLVVAAMLLSTAALAAPDYVNLDDVFPFVKEGANVTLTIGVPGNESLGEPETVWYWKWMKDKSGVNYDFVVIDSSVRDEKINLMFASGDVPDIIMGEGFNNLDIIKYGSEMGMLMPMNDLIDAYAPVLTAFFEEHPTAKASCVAPDGNIYALCSWVDELPDQMYSDRRSWINQKWLDTLGLERPSTLDEMHDVLVAFRDQDPNGNGVKDEIPICDTAQNVGYLIWYALGVVDLSPTALTPCLKDGQAIIPASSDLYRHYIEIMRQWYEEGLIDQDCYTLNGAQQQAKAAEGKVGAHVGSAPHTVQSEGWEDFEAWPCLTSEWNDTPVYPGCKTLNTGSIVMSSTCQEKEVAMRFINWLYTDQASIYGQYGPMEGSEDETYGVHGWYFDEAGNGPLHHRDESDPYFKESDLFYRQKVVAQIYNQGLKTPFASILRLYGIVAAGRTGAAGHWRRSMNEYQHEYFQDLFPSVFLSAEDSATITELYTPLSDYVSITEAKLITGIEPMENFDNYVAQLYKLGLEEYTEIYTRAYEAYVANLG